MHPISDKGEVAIDFPDKAYMGGFGRECSFDARADADGMMIRLVRTSGEKREAEIHLHHFLFASILDELADSLGKREPIDKTHRQPLLVAARKLVTALERRTPAAAQ
jgi:hypothetical protein